MRPCPGVRVAPPSAAMGCTVRRSRAGVSAAVVRIGVNYVRFKFESQNRNGGRFSRWFRHMPTILKASIESVAKSQLRLSLMGEAVSRRVSRAGPLRKHRLHALGKVEALTSVRCSCRSRCTDDTAANDNLAALEEFFRLFPEYSKQPFHRTGTAPHWRCAHTRADFVLGACHAPRPGVGACACAHAYAIVRGGSAMMQHAMYRCRSACTCTACSPLGRLCP